MEEFGEVLKNVSLKNYNTYKIGGNAKYLVKPYNIDNLIKLIDYLNNNNIKHLVLGGGSNIILPDEDYDGCIILLNNINNIDINERNVVVGAGISLNMFINKLIENNLSGLENIYGIPGTIGGAIKGNAGCHGSEISDYLKNVIYLEDGVVKKLDKEKCMFSYRNSIFKNDKNKIILEATFELKNGNSDEMKNIIKENMKKRLMSQPLEYPNAGSVFKNPDGFSSGILIEDTGLKGYSIGGAYVSDKHANFIVNKGNAKSEDIINLINYIKNNVKEKYKIDLELEQEIIVY